MTPSTVTSEVLSIELDHHVATLWLDNAERRNAMGPDFWADLPRAIGELGADDEVRAVVIAARGPHFSVGLDLKALPLSPDPSAATGGEGRSASQARRAFHSYKEIKRLQASITAVADCPKPVIAAVHGYCIGGGIDLISACDVRIAAEGATFSVRETKIAIVADLGTLQRLPRIIGRGHAAELALTGKDIDATRAREIGLVNDVTPDAVAALGAAHRMAAEIAANSPLAVQGTKAVLRAGEGRTVAEGLDYVAAWNAGFLPSHDLTEALTAFVEKRAPAFTGD